jgi:hypothetical protein
VDWKARQGRFLGKYRESAAVTINICANDAVFWSRKPRLPSSNTTEQAAGFLSANP